jgi:hypothetical protein
MDESKEETKLVKRAPNKFTYNPEAVDIATLNHLVFDHLHYKLMCKQAADLGLNVNKLIAMIFEKYLINTGYLDPKSPQMDHIKPVVTIQDIRENPTHIVNFFPNSLVHEKFAETSFGYKPKEDNESVFDSDGIDIRDYE